MRSETIIRTAVHFRETVRFRRPHRGFTKSIFSVCFQYVFSIIYYLVDSGRLPRVDFYNVKYKIYVNIMECLDVKQQVEKYEKLLKEGGDIQIGMLHCSQAVKVSRF